MSSWQAERDSNDIVWLTVDKPGGSANVLSKEVLEDLDAQLAQLEARLPAGVVVRSGKPSGFIAGADIREFTTLTDLDGAYELVRRGQRVLDRLEALPCPTVAIIQGFALGGGLEVALACRYRIGVDNGKLSLGLPEVNLGIHPGFGGTVRSVRLLGVEQAMPIMLTGRPVRGEKALEIGLIDRLTPEDRAEETARELIARRPSPHQPGLRATLLSLAPVRGFVAGRLRAQVARKARREHYPAPYAMVELWEKYGAKDDAAYEAEARSIAKLFLSDTARGLIRVFFLQDKLKGLAGGAKANIRNVHVVGAGVMGGDIAAWSALRGFNVTLQDREDKYVQPAMARGRALFEKKLHDDKSRTAATERLRADVAGDGVAEADIIVEAIFENLEAKQQLYAKIEPRMKPGAILATNTSSIVLETLNAQLSNRGHFVGLHFFNPVAQMPLIEVIATEQTDEQSTLQAIAFARRLDKLPLPCRSSPGFLVNRVLVPYLHEAMRAINEGIPMRTVDAAAEGFGMPMGPIELVDTVGLDVAQHVGEIVTKAMSREPADDTRLKALIADGKLGRKSGQGFYVWQDGKAIKPDAGNAVVPADLEDRLILALVNECVACLREKVVADGELLDAGVIFGTGFAPFRGGPLNYARHAGIDNMLKRLSTLEQRYGSRFRADPGWDLLRNQSAP
ncbi:MAG: 3-hydroxyacyl-CoA dehydrogenase NAD-binding domain-containing protein [Steroidobacteraceae bacterium]